MFPQFSHFSNSVSNLLIFQRENSIARGLLITVRSDLRVFTLMTKNQGPCILETAVSTRNKTTLATKADMLQVMDDNISRLNKYHGEEIDRYKASNRQIL